MIRMDRICSLDGKSGKQFNEETVTIRRKWFMD